MAYVGLPHLSRPAKIWYFEVSSDARRRGNGRRAINLLVSELGPRTLFAFSEEADLFWEGIGWHHYPRSDGDATYQRLYVQPTQPNPPQLVRRIR